MIDEYIYVDYENVQDIKVEFIKNTSKVIILIGNEQIKFQLIWFKNYNLWGI